MTNPKLFTDLADLAGGAAQVFSSLKKQLRDETRERMDSFAMRMDLVTQDDIERLEGMVAKLRARVEALEQKLGGKPTKSAPPKAKKKTPAAKTGRNPSGKKK